MNSAKKLVFMCSIVCSSLMLGMDSNNNGDPSVGNSGQPSTPIGFAGLLSSLGTTLDTGLSFIHNKSEHMLFTATLGTRALLYLKQRKRIKPEHEGYTDKSDEPNNNDLTDDIRVLTDSMKKQKDKKRKSQVRFVYSPGHRYYMGALGRGIETADSARVLASIALLSPYMGISRKTDEDKQFTPLVRYGEVAGSYVDAERMWDYVALKSKHVRGNAYEENVPRSIQYGVKRAACGGTAVALATAKHDVLPPEKIMTYRIVEVGSHFAREWAETDDCLINDAIDSVQEAAQRTPWIEVGASYAGSTVFGEKQEEGFKSVKNAAIHTGVNAAWRFAFKQVPHALELTETGQDILNWTHDTVPVTVVDIAKEATVAGLTVGSIAVGKQCWDLCCQQ